MPELFDVTGLDILRAQLRDLGDRGARAAVRNAARHVARDIASDAKERAPVDTGALRKSIGVREISREGAHIAGVRDMAVAVPAKRRGGKRLKRPRYYAAQVDRRIHYMGAAVSHGRKVAPQLYRQYLEQEIRRISARGLRGRRR